MSDDNALVALSQRLLPQSMTELMEYAEMLASSALIPPEYRDRKADILVAIQLGLAVGLPPMQALQSIAVIRGRPTIWGDAVIGLVMASGLLTHYEDGVAGTGESLEGWCRVARKGLPEPVERRFSYAQAKRAGLLARSADQGKGPGPWLTYPERMVVLRARSWALRDAFGDVLKGLAIREEAEETVLDVAPTLSELMPRAVDVSPSVPQTTAATETAPTAAEAGTVTFTIRDRTVTTAGLTKPTYLALLKASAEMTAAYSAEQTRKLVANLVGAGRRAEQLTEPEGQMLLEALRDEVARAARAPAQGKL